MPSSCARVLIFGGAGVFQWGSARVPGESLAALTLLRGAGFEPPLSPFCSSVQPREVLMCPEGQIPCSLCPDSGGRWRSFGDRGPPAPPAFLLLCFLGARSSSLRSTPSALLRPSERSLASAPSPAKSLHSWSLLFLVCRRPSLRWPRAHTRVPGYTGPAEQSAYRTKPAGIPQTVGVSLLVTVRGRRAPWPRVLIFGGAGVFQWGSAGVPEESLAALTLLRSADFGPPPSPFCSSVQPREFLMCPEGQILCSLCPDSGCRCRSSGDQGPPAPPTSLLLCLFGARSSILRSTPSALLQPSAHPLAPAPSPAKPLYIRSLLFLVCRPPSPRWLRAHTRVPGCTGPAKQTAPKFLNLHRSLSASLRSVTTVLQCPPQLSRSAIAVFPQGWV
ncbi:hypothetical protein NDU88_007093 [Pleurodeles waltl]|uniref:Uncharacterized protein n=1 Tax=Pleurodeles waltl TaxID=8319 RepID=A0AAV7SRG4_PLEWA|nr:hypothetical protein NDU88_007093 [Pleurodeles waltl]